MKSIAEADVKGKRVIVRADLNVPMKDGVVTDATRIERFLPTVKDLTERGAKVVIVTHFGRPKGQKEPSFSLLPVTKELATRLGHNIVFAEDAIGTPAKNAVERLQDGEVAMLENVRFHAGEEADDEDFAKQLAENGDIYCNDAFSCSHRAHASTHGIAKQLPAYAGPSMKKELDALNMALSEPERPLAAVVGGAKVSTKIPVLTNLAKRVDMLIIGGGMANTFLHAQGVNVGKSLCEPDFASTVAEITEQAKESGCRILLPIDVVVAKEFAENAPNAVHELDDIPEDGMILDSGPKSIEMLKEELAKCKTVLWNGPLGAFEIEPFGKATFALAQDAARLTKEGKLVSVAGGGDTVAALNAAGVSDDFTYISTAGGAFLEWLEGRELPGVVALELNS